MRSPKSFNWLHLTDLHFGHSLPGRRPLWPNVRYSFFDDLSELHKVCGPWNAVLLTGDLVQTGRLEEFATVESEFLARLWQELDQMGSGDAVLLAVPGNHDLVRPQSQKPPPALRQLLRPNGFAEIEEEFWLDPESDYRKVVSAAFANYQDWWHRTRFRSGILVQEGLLPGDFATSLNVGSHSVGIIGLNSTFLQLNDGDYKGRLALNAYQLQAVCNGNVEGWLDEHEVSLLLTHQGPDWLDARSRESYPEINPAGRFAVHLFGHMQDTTFQSISGSGQPRHWQGSSLAGLQAYGERNQHDRRYGYSAGSITFGKRASLRIWSRRMIIDAHGWRFVPDHESRLMDDGGTEERLLEGHKGPSRQIPRQTAPSSDSHVFLTSEELLYLAFRLVVARRAGPDLLLHLDAARLREAMEGVLDESSRGKSFPQLRLRAVPTWLAEQFPDARPDPLWQKWMLITQGKALEDIAAALASAPSSSAPPA